MSRAVSEHPELDLVQLTDLSPHPCSCQQNAGSPLGGGHKHRGVNFLFRKVHGVVGLIFGAFLIVHLIIASTAHSTSRFDQNAASLHTLASNLPAAELVAVFLPVIVLLLSGGFLLARAGLSYNVKKCNRGNKLQFFLQRVTAVIVLLFMALHLSRFGRWAIWPVFDPALPSSSVRTGMRTFVSSLPATHALNLAIFAVTLLGIVAAVYHLANGLWTAGLFWKLSSSPIASRRWGFSCAALGLFIGTIGVWAWAAFLG